MFSALIQKVIRNPSRNSRSSIPSRPVPVVLVITV
jgi:hypothetical protein